MADGEVSNLEARAELPLAFHFTDEIMQNAYFATGIPRSERLAMAYDLGVRLVRIARAQEGER